MVFIYVLQLEKGKYYVGKTNNLQFRMDQHFNSNGSEWTKLYKPIKIVEFKSNCDDYDEDKITIQYMDKYGIDNVRGGSFANIKLHKNVIDMLKKMSHGANNKCFTCGKAGHFAKECKMIAADIQGNNAVDKADVQGNNAVDKAVDDVWICDHCGKEFTQENKCKYHEKICKENKEICKCVFSYLSTHKKINCILNIENYVDEQKYTPTRQVDRSQVSICFRCGRKGHYVASCYATTHSKGYYL